MERWAKRQRLTGGASRPSWNKSDGSGENNGWIGESGDHIKQLQGRENPLVRPRPVGAVPNTQEQGIGEENHAHSRYHLFPRRNMVTGVSHTTYEGTPTPPSATQIPMVSSGDIIRTAGDTSFISVTADSPETASRIPRATLEPGLESVTPSASPTLASVIQVPSTASESGLVSLVVLPPDATALSTSETTETPASYTQSPSQSLHPSSLTSTVPSSSYEPNSSTHDTQTTQLLPTTSASQSPIITSSPSTLPSSSGSGNLSLTSSGNTSGSITGSESPVDIIAASVPTSASASPVDLSSLVASLSQSLASSSINSTLSASAASVLSTSTSPSLSQSSVTTAAEPSSSTESSSISASSTSPSTTGATGGLAPGSGPAPPGAVAPPDRPGDGGSAPSSNQGPPTPVLVGGIVGGVAGLAIIILVLLVLLRWRKHKQQRLGQSSSAGGSQRSPPSTGVAPPASGGGLTETSSSPPRALGAAGFLDRFRPVSQQTTSSEAAPSDRGFYRVAGRKIAPALSTGGDGYQGPTLSETSFYRDDGGFYGGPGTSARPVSEGTFSGRGSGASERGIPVMRPSPARRAVTSEGPSTPTLSPPVGSSPRRRPDVIGRSHPSHDGSRGSRFTEDVV